MTTQSSPTCPRCQTQALVFVRDGAWTEGVDNLVCLSESCRGGVVSPPRSAPAGLDASA